MKLPIGYDPAFSQSDSLHWFSIEPDYHTAIFGKSGTGKSTLLKKIAVALIRSGAGVTILDPHGSLVDDVLKLIPKTRTHDFCWFDPRATKPIGVNFFDGQDKHLVTEHLVSVFNRLYGATSWPRTEYLLTNGTRAVFESEDRPTFLTLHKLFTNDEFRRAIFAKTTDPIVLDFARTYQEWPDRFREEATAPILNKLSKLLASELARHILAQGDSLNFRDILEKKKLLLCRLCKGTLGEEFASLLGSLVVSKLMLSAFKREGKAFNKMPPHYLIIDEVQSFTKAVPLDVILAEARKYRLTLILATQTIEQIPEDSRYSVFGNANTIICYRMSGADAEIMAKHFGDQFSPTTLIRLANYRYVAQTVDNSIPKEPRQFAAFESPKQTGDEQAPLVLLEQSERQYGSDRKKVEDSIRRYLEL